MVHIFNNYEESILIIKKIVMIPLITFYFVVRSLVPYGRSFLVLWELIGSCLVKLLISPSVRKDHLPWEMIPCCLMWVIWRERNVCSFKDYDNLLVCPLQIHFTIEWLLIFVVEFLDSGTLLVSFTYLLGLSLVYSCTWMIPFCF